MLKTRAEGGESSKFRPRTENETYEIGNEKWDTRGRDTCSSG